MSVVMPKVVMPQAHFGAPPPPPPGPPASGFSKAGPAEAAAGDEARPHATNGSSTLSKAGNEVHWALKSALPEAFASRAGGDWFVGGMAKAGLGGVMMPPQPPPPKAGFTDVVAAVEDSAAKRQRTDQAMPHPGWSAPRPNFGQATDPVAMVASAPTPSLGGMTMPGNNTGMLLGGVPLPMSTMSAPGLTSMPAMPPAPAPPPPPPTASQPALEVTATAPPRALAAPSAAQPATQQQSTSRAVPSAPPRKMTEEEIRWRDQWAEVFALFMEGDIESRAGEYAEAVVALWRQADALKRQLETVQESCDQLLFTANREALRHHIQNLIESASIGVPQDIQDAARRELEANMPPEVAVPPRGVPEHPGIPGTGAGGGSTGSGFAPVASHGAGFGGSMRGNANMASVPPPPLQPQTQMLPKAGLPPNASIPPPLPPNAAMPQIVDHNNVYVSGLPPGIDDSMFRQLFSSYGAILSTKVVPEKSYGFVKFAMTQDAQSAIDALNNFEFNGTRLSVRFATRDSSLGGPLPGLGIAAAAAEAATFGAMAAPRPPASMATMGQGQPTLL